MYQKEIVLNYFFEDFTEKNYRYLISLAKERYDFVKFSDINCFKPLVVWRHDIDLSVHRALRLARIEYEEWVKTTYFILLNSEFYNIFENKIKDRISEILSLGHSLGLHFDPTAYSIKNKRELEHYLTFEKGVLENLFDVEIKLFSFQELELAKKWVTGSSQ